MDNADDGFKTDPTASRDAPRPVGRPPKKRTKTICLVVDHVHLPVDLSTPDWRTAQETRKYAARADGSRVKYEVHPELADFLVGRDQAISLDD